MMKASKTLLITVLITSAFSAQVSKAADVTPAMPKNPPCWISPFTIHYSLFTISPKATCGVFDCLRQN